MYTAMYALAISSKPEVLRFVGLRRLIDRTASFGVQSLLEPPIRAVDAGYSSAVSTRTSVLVERHSGWLLTYLSTGKR